MTSEHTTPRVPTRADTFATTHWTVVLAAGQGRTVQADTALEELCHTYWYPLYAYVRRRGHTHEDAEDLTQGFFARFLERNYLEGLTSEKGKFRAFLLASLKHFMANEWNRAHAQKRGGETPALSLDWQSADSRYQINVPDDLSPDKIYDREWALALLERVITRLRDECNASDQARLFDSLKPFLTMDKAAVPYAQAAAELNLAEGAVRVAVHRLRKRYRGLLRDEITQTLADPAQVEEEMRTLLGAFG
ncbi:MAG TPA: sigma factor [Verrucomicrobiae bacterium]|nr:sigma factor [Verrucomicrobiae bacterium]